MQFLPFTPHFSIRFFFAFAKFPKTLEIFPFSNQALFDFRRLTVDATLLESASAIPSKNQNQR